MAAILRADPLQDFAKQLTSSNTVTITTNLLFYLSSDGDPANQFKSDNSIRYNVCPNPFYTSGTNYMWVQFFLFPLNQAFDFRLLDDKGNEVQKTKLGVANGQPAHLPTTMHEFDQLKYILRRQNEAIRGSLFRPDEMFMITNKGVYTMEVRMRICVQITNGVPDYQVMQDKSQFPHGPFGIVVSKPLRVKIVKE